MVRLQNISPTNHKPLKNLAKILSFAISLGGLFFAHPVNNKHRKLRTRIRSQHVIVNLLIVFIGFPGGVYVVYSSKLLVTATYRLLVTGYGATELHKHFYSGRTWEEAT